MTAIVGKPGAKSGIVAFSQGARGIGYEEGTWTPGFGTSVTHGASVLAVTGTLGQYVKVGRLVRVNFSTRRNDGGTFGSGNLYLTNLPFTAKYP